MKQKEEKKLRLGKMTIQNFDTVLDHDYQKRINGGKRGNTVVPVYCKQKIKDE